MKGSLTLLWVPKCVALCKGRCPAYSPRSPRPSSAQARCPPLVPPRDVLFPYQLSGCQPRLPVVSALGRPPAGVKVGPHLFSLQDLLSPKIHSQDTREFGCLFWIL